MAKIFYILLLIPLLSWAAEKPKPAPKAKTPAPVVQQQQERPKEDPNAIKTGPYDKDGNYIYLHKKP